MRQVNYEYKIKVKYRKASHHNLLNKIINHQLMFSPHITNSPSYIPVQGVISKNLRLVITKKLVK